MANSFFFWPFTKKKQENPQSIQDQTNLSKEIVKLQAQIKALTNVQLKHIFTIQTNIKKEIEQLRTQLEAYANLQLFFSTGQLLPPMHGWPISPDFGLELIRRLQGTNYQAIFEFGSGSSTLLVTKTLQTLHRSTLHVVFEHENQYLQKTLNLLLQAGLPLPQLHLAPLHPIPSPVPNAKYYDCSKILASYSQGLNEGLNCRFLCIVDGPPGTTCQKARVPVLEHILTAFPKLTAVDIFLDDCIRPDERACVEDWKALLTNQNYQIQQENLPLEKGAIFLSGSKTVPANS